MRDAGAPEARITDDLAAEGIPGLHAHFCSLGPVASVHDDAGPDDAAERLEQLVLHVAPGGLWDAPATEDVLALADKLSRLRRKFAEPRRPLPESRRRRARIVLARSVTAEPEGDRVHFRVDPPTPVLPKLREEQADLVLASLPERGQVLHRLPGARVDAVRRVRASGTSPYNTVPDHYEAPPLSLREYTDVVCLSRQASCTDRWVLPESYRDPFRRRRHHVLDDCGRLFAARPDTSARRLPGRWFLLDTYEPLHFGHAMTEQLARLWGWRAAKAADPSLRALVFVPPGREVASWTWDLLSAGGVAREDVEVAHAPVRVERLVGCTPSYTIGGYVHPEMGRVWREVGDALEAASALERRPRRIFASRGGHQRVCRNGDEVESLFASHGFEIVRPERLPLADQVALFRGADVVAGYAGSAMFHVALSDRPQHVIAIATESYPAHNETAMTALLGHALDLVVCRPDVPRVDPDTFSEASFQSDYVVDWSAEGDWLRRRLAEL